MPHTRILIVVGRKDARDAYEEALASAGAAYDVAANFQEMQAMCTERSYNGLLIDIQTLIRCNKHEKLIAYDCINLYPTIRLTFDAKQKQIRLSPLEEAYSAGPAETLRYFIAQRCGSFAARSLRKHHRADVNLNVLLCAGDVFAADRAQRTFTMNISEGGAFVHAVHPFAEGETVSLQIAELSDRTPIRATVRWGIGWGMRSCICGIGIQFREISEQQLEQIRRYAG